jgi:hypothetical protein
LFARSALAILPFFNREFRHRRLQAQAKGRPFMPYRAAQARLRRALVGVAAGDRPGLITRVFGPQWPCCFPSGAPDWPFDNKTIIRISIGL